MAGLVRRHDGSAISLKLLTTKGEVLLAKADGPSGCYSFDKVLVKSGDEMIYCSGKFPHLKPVASRKINKEIGR
jgi:hypothetical protein